MREDSIPTWSQRREAELELWAEAHLSDLALVVPGALADPATLRSVATRARALADCAERLRHLRGDGAQVDAEAAALRAALDTRDR